MGSSCSCLVAHTAVYRRPQWARGDLGGDARLGALPVVGQALELDAIKGEAPP